jgi:hypothetical protein
MLVLSAGGKREGNMSTKKHKRIVSKTSAIIRKRMGININRLTCERCPFLRACQSAAPDQELSCEVDEATAEITQEPRGVGKVYMNREALYDQPWWAFDAEVW